MADPVAAADGAAGASLCERLGRFAGWLERGGRSPLYVALLRGAAEDCARGGVVARAFEGIDVPPGAVPALRLMAALHHLVLGGQAPELARFYPSAGGREGRERAWPAAEATLHAHLGDVRARLRRGVQTNEPGRSAALYGGLLWASERFGAPLRLLEIGASAGLNLLADRFAYEVDGELLGLASSPVRFEEPWRGLPVSDAPAAARRLRVVERVGCDLEPIDVRAPGTRELLLSYVWPDEPQRLARLEAALSVARARPPAIMRGRASEWLPRVLSGAREGVSLVMQSVMWQYLDAHERASVSSAIERAGERRELVWLTLEPEGEGVQRFALSARVWPRGERVLLARCGDHGPPVEWVAS